MGTLNDGFKAIADLNLWYKLRNSDALTLGDMRQLIPGRWYFMRDNWSTIKRQLTARIPSYANPELLTNQINALDSFIEVQKYSKNSGNPFNNTSIFFQFQAVFDIMDLSTLAPTHPEQKSIDQITQRINSFTKNNFIDLRTKIQAAHDTQSDLVTGSDADYDRVYGRTAATPLSTVTPHDIQVLDNFNNSIKACNFILANLTDLNTVTVDPFAMAKINANNPDFNVQSSTGGNLVRMQYGDTLAALALRYLGDSDRWIEIAIANGLKAPYIDETGSTLALAINGALNKIVLPGLDAQLQSNADKFAVNQIVFLSSDTLLFPEQRTITDITKIPVSGEVVLRLSGDLDLDKFKKVDNASIRFFKLHTINSQFFIMIPSPTATVTAPPTDTLWFLRTKQADEKQAGVDLALSTDNDLIFASNGDLVLSYGLANAIQAVQIKLSTEYGSLNRHDDFGIVNVIGRPTTSLAPTQEELTQSIVQSIEDDSRFSAVQSIEVTALNGVDNRTMGTGFLVQLVVRLAGTGSEVPISFTVNV